MPNTNLMRELMELCREVYARGFNDSNPVGELTEAQEIEWNNRRDRAVMNALIRAGVKL